MTRILDIDEEETPALDLRAVVERVRGLLYVAVSDAPAAEGAMREVARLLFDHSILNYVTLPTVVTPPRKKKRGLPRSFAAQAPRFLSVEQLRAIAEIPEPAVVAPLVDIPTSSIFAGVTAVQPPLPTWRQLTASKFDTNCRKCVVRITVGQSCWWLRDYGCHCLTCGPGVNP